MTIPLPEVSAPRSLIGHPYPMQLALQTAGVLQGAMFHAAIADEAAGQKFRQPNGFNEVKAAFEAMNMGGRTWDLGWELLGQYKPVFENSPLQACIVTARGEWDWYVRRLGEFITFARQHTTAPVLTRRQNENLDLIGRREIRVQMATLEAATGLTLSPDPSAIGSIVMMTHVRNLGLHNRWEVDRMFLDSHPDCGLSIGQLRVPQKADLDEWSEAVRRLIHHVSTCIAQHYATVPDYL